MENIDNQGKFQQRQVAFITDIEEVNSGEFVKNEGWNPSFIISNNKKMSRVNLIGVIVSINEGEGFGSASFEDGSGTIDLIFFDNKDVLNTLNIGSPVTVIGRVREYNGKKSVIPEIIKPLEDMAWLDVRKLQNRLEKLNHPKEESFSPDEEEVISVAEKEDSEVPEEEIVVPSENISQPKENNFDKICRLIESIDKGSGADHQEVVDSSNLDPDSAEKIISHLLSEGEIFEVSPGKLKVLD